MVLTGTLDFVSFQGLSLFPVFFPKEKRLETRTNLETIQNPSVVNKISTLIAVKMTVIALLSKLFLEILSFSILLLRSK